LDKILIVDDSEMVRMQVSNILIEAGYKVFEAEGGIQAINLAKENPDIKMILSDYNMPDMSGLEVLQAIKETPAHQKTICGVLTTESSPALKQVGKAVGVSFWIVKPVDALKLKRVAAMVMQKYTKS